MSTVRCEDCGADINAMGIGSHRRACGPYVCVCVTPEPGDVGGRECARCRRLIVANSDVDVR